MDQAATVDAKLQSTVRIWIIFSVTLFAMNEHFSGFSSILLLTLYADGCKAQQKRPLSYR